MAKVFEDWCPQVGAVVDDVKLEIGKLTRHWDRSVHDLASMDPALVPIPKSAFERPPITDPSADGPHGHHVESIHRDEGFGSVYTHTAIPVKGACSLPTPTFPRSGPRSYGCHQDSSHMGKLPKL